MRRASRHASARSWALAALGVLCACAGPRSYDEPMGVLPTAVTSAEPLWLPFSFRAGKRVEADPREAHLIELRQLTFDGRSARPAWRPDGRGIVFERRDEKGCAKIVALDLGSGETRELTAEGCASDPIFDGERLVHARSVEPPRCQLWAATGDFTGCDLVGIEGVAEAPGFDGEPFAARGAIVFTSTRDGDPELYRLVDGAVTRITRRRGYDGGAVLSPDGGRLAWHAAAAGAWVPEAAADAPGEETTPARRPAGALDIMIAGSAGQHPRAVTTEGRNLHPAFLADSRRLLYASDRDAPLGAAGELELYLVDPDGPLTAAGPPTERVTFSPGYDAEARLSPDGHHVLFTSSRGGDAASRNVFVARWRD